MKTLCSCSHEHATKQAARACDAKMLGRCLAVMAWAQDKLLKEAEQTGDGHSGATMRAVAWALDVETSPRLKA